MVLLDIRQESTYEMGAAEIFKDKDTKIKISPTITIKVQNIDQT